MSKLNKKRYKFLASIISVLFVVSIITPAFAESLSDYYKRRDYYANQANQAKQKAAEKQKEAEELQNQITVVDKQITETESSITNTENQISKTEMTISDLEEAIKKEEKNLENEKEKLGGVVSSWYMEGESGLLEAVVGSNNISEIVTKQQYYDAIKQQMEAQIERINKAKALLQSRKNEQETQLGMLDGLRSDQISQQKALETRKSLKNRLLNDTSNTISELKELEQNAQAKIKEIDEKIKILTATQYWGNEIVSSNDSSWYYTQTGNYTKLGISPFTVHQYGCLITSMAMVATFYGNSVTPTDIASNTSLFDRDGYLLVSSPPGIGVNIEGSKAVNWAIVEDEIANGRPVIVSVYLPSVGAVNRDGSSHFIVIKGKSGDKYLMHDPISGQRGYNRSQIRSMKLIRSN